MFETELTNDNQFLFAIRVNGVVYPQVYEFTDHGSLTMMLNACKEAALAKWNEEMKPKNVGEKE